LPLPKIALRVVVVLVTVVVLVSLAYPSITVSSATTQTFPTFVTLTNGYTTGYPQSSSTIVLAESYVSTEWYPGNGLCDPASMACTPQPIPTVTITYTQWSTYFYQVTVYSQLSTTYTSESAAVSTQTSYQTVAPYAAAGISEFQYGLAAMLIFAAVVATILFFYGKESARGRMENPERAVRSASATKYCTQCGTENPQAGAVCGKCGARLE